jgi:hypothetical protein
MRRELVIALIALIAGVVVGMAGHALLFSNESDDKSGIYCYHPNALDPTKKACIRRGPP